MHLSTLFPIAAFAISVSASLPGSPFSRLMSSQGLGKRQDAACVSTCQTYTTAGTACGDNAACICDPVLFNGLLSCANCALVADPSQLPVMQEYFTGIAAACEASGFAVGDPTIHIGGTSNAATTQAAVQSSQIIVSSAQPANATSAVISASSSPVNSESSSVASSSISVASTSSRSSVAAAATATATTGLSGMGHLAGMLQTKNGASAIQSSITSVFIGVGIGALLAGLL